MHPRFGGDFDNRGRPRVFSGLHRRAADGWVFSFLAVRVPFFDLSTATNDPLSQTAIDTATYLRHNYCHKFLPQV